MQAGDCLGNCVLCWILFYLVERCPKIRKEEPALNRKVELARPTWALLYNYILHALVQYQSRILILVYIRELIQILPVRHELVFVHVYRHLCSVSHAQLLRTDITVYRLARPAASRLPCLTLSYCAFRKSWGVIHFTLYSNGMERDLSQTKEDNSQSFSWITVSYSRPGSVTVFYILSRFPACWNLRDLSQKTVFSFNCAWIVC